MSKYYTLKTVKITTDETKLKLLVLRPTINAKPKHKTPEYYGFMAEIICLEWQE